MRHPYVGDVGDYGKYGLLRVVGSSPKGFRLGVVWYLTDAQEHNNDGKHDGYLKNGSKRDRDSFRSCDPALYDRMGEIRQNSKLDVNMVEDGTVLPANTIFHNPSVPTFQDRKPMNEGNKQRWDLRDQWHSNAMRTVAKARCVFTDPDNGIIFTERAKVVRRKASHKHSYWHEIADYLARKQNVIAYHHLGRQKGGHEAHIADCLGRIASAGFDAWAIHYRRGTARAFFVIPIESDRAALWERSQRYINAWGLHAALIERKSS